MTDDLGRMRNMLEPAANGQGVATIEWFAEQIPGGFFIYSAFEPLRIIYANEAMLRIFGCETLDEFKDLTGYTFRGLVHPDDFAHVQASIDEQISDEANKSIDYVEYRIIRKDGSVRWVDDYGHLGQFPGYGDAYYVFIGDITEKHLLQEELRRRSNVYEGMIEQYRDVSQNSLTVYRANATADVIEEVSGRDPFDCDVAGGSLLASWHKRLESFLSDADRDAYVDLFRADALVDRYYKGLGPATAVAYCRRQSGRQCFVKFTGSAVVDPVSGDVVVLGIESEYNSERVTEILNEKVLAQQYDMVCYLVGDNYGVVIGDADRIEHPSIFPKTRDGSYARYISEQVLPLVDTSVHDAEELEADLSLKRVAERLGEEEFYVVDVTCVVDGAIVNKRFTYYLVDAESSFYILLKSDVTELLRQERLRNDLLASALREAEHANIAKTSFLSNMSHEIRTPMNAIIGYDTIALKEPSLDSKTRTYLKRIGDSAKHLLSLINDILDMSRIESGRMTIKREEFSFADMLEQINTMVQAQCDDKGLRFECRTRGRLGDRYIGDDMKLKQVIINMLSNAVKFTDPGGDIVFTVEKVSDFEGHSTLRFTVADTGIGMEASFLPHIFDAFSQESGSGANRYGSTGLGMAITKNIVDMMNGTIEVQSEKGVGSSFTVTVTLKNGAGTSFGMAHLPRPSDLKVLVVDDEPIACDHARLVLEEVGVSADTVLEADAALRLIEVHHAKGEPYDLILMDWKMPVVDGIELTREIRARYHDEMTIVILTTYNWDDIMEEALEAGIDGFMSKPLFASSVLSEFSNIVQRKGIHSEEEPVDLAGRRILLAEDVAINAEILMQVLDMREMKVEHAENGKECLDLFAQSEPFFYDAILMDVRMPVMDGLAATRAIRALGREDAKSVPIIALTANAFDEDVQRTMQAGMNAHLTKPVELDSLFSMLERMMRDR